MSQPSRANNLIVFPSSRPNSKSSRLDTVRCRMLPAPHSASSKSWPPISAKAKALAEKQPHAAALIEELLDDLLEDVS